MTRILAYNILVGGTQHIEQLTSIIRSTHPDIIGLVEATNPQVVEELANRLGMEFRLTGQGKRAKDWQLAVLSLFPIIQARVHTHPNIFTRQHILEVCVEEPGGNPLTIFVVHLTSRFHKGFESNRTRRREVQEILDIMASQKGTPHLLMGDFNSLAPGERLKGSFILRYFRGLDYYYKQKPSLFVPYPDLSTLFPLRRYIRKQTMYTILRSRLLSALLDWISPVYAQGGIDLLLKAGYVDCFRRVNPRSPGFTCPAAAPAGRIDFIFASPEVAQRLSNCCVVTEGEGVHSEEASDHLPVCAEFD